MLGLGLGLEYNQPISVDNEVAAHLLVVGCLDSSPFESRVAGLWNTSTAVICRSLTSVRLARGPSSVDLGEFLITKDCDLGEFLL